MGWRDPRKHVQPLQALLDTLGWCDTRATHVRGIRGRNGIAFAQKASQRRSALRAGLARTEPTGVTGLGVYVRGPLGYESKAAPMGKNGRNEGWEAAVGGGCFVPFSTAPAPPSTGLWPRAGCRGAWLERLPDLESDGPSTVRIGTIIFKAQGNCLAWGGLRHLKWGVTPPPLRHLDPTYVSRT